jgi:GT2 family glycosyltransferase
MMDCVTACIVLYCNERLLLLAAINSFLEADSSSLLYLVDNSPTDDLKDIILTPRVKYIFNGVNLGFGAAHNVAIKKALAHGSTYHLVLNPDVYFGTNVLTELTSYMETDPKIGVLMPKILYPDNTLQRVAKLLPTPLNFFVRRFMPFGYLSKKIDSNFELHNYDYTYPLNIPFLSGCFLLFKAEVLEAVQGFDEAIFMYTEDIDICRRSISAGYKCMLYPDTSIYHDHEKKSFFKFKVFKMYSRSAVYYFNKWGWLFDNERSQINKATLSEIRDNN